MLFSSAIRQRINYYLSKNNMTIWKLYKASGVPKSTLFALMKENASIPKLDTLLHICEGFGITIREFFDDDIFNDVEYENNNDIL